MVYYRLVLICVFQCFALISMAQKPVASTSGDPFHQLQFRYIGPPGNRATAIIGEPGNPLVMYIGAASGGVFKSSDGGTQWKPIFDDQNVSAIGALAIPRQEPHTIWVGTGESWLIRPDHAMGDGVYKSTNSGQTWSRMGLDATGHIARIVIDPYDNKTVYVCAVGQAYRPQRERGIFKTIDGGQTWKQVLFVDEHTGCSDLAMDPHDGQTLFAGMWPLSISTWKLDSGGVSGGIYVTHNGGETWQKVSGHGLPTADKPVGKVAVQIAPTDPDRVYALLEQTTPTLYRSDDGGKTWSIAHRNHRLSERAPYFTRFGVSPSDENLLYFLSAGFSLSRDSGDHIIENMEPFAGDNHDIWIDPENPNRILLATDHGASISLDGAKTYYQVILPIAQMYHAFTDNQIPYNVYGNMQDGPSFMGPSNNLEGQKAGFFGGSITAGDWKSFGGCESGFGVPDPDDSYIVWSGCYDGQLDRMDMRSGQARNVSAWPAASYGWAPAVVKYRWHWTFPIAISPHDHNTVYIGSQYVHVTHNGGQSWTIISPDLTLNDKSHEQNSGGMVNDNLETFDGATLYSIAESPMQKDLLWAGTNDGQVSITRDGGQHWNNVTRNIPSLPPWGTVSNVEPSHFDVGSAYVTVDLQQLGNYDPYVYKTSNFGETWKLISTAIPKSVSSFAHCIREDPVRKGLLYLGTDNGLYVSWDDGSSWTHLRSNLPPAPVYWLTIQSHFSDLVIATYGRGFWILDDITWLRYFDKVDNDTLFPIRSAYRFRNKQDYRAHDWNSSSVGENPPNGADIDFYLKEVPREIEIVIKDSEGNRIRTIKKRESEQPMTNTTSQTANPGVVPESGLNRFWWDLRYDPLTQVRWRVSPPGEPWVAVDATGTRPFSAFDSETPPPRVPPGTYNVSVVVDGKIISQPLTILPDPHSLGTEEQIRKQVAFSLGLVKELNHVADMVNQAESLRLQLEQVKNRVTGAVNTADAASKLDGLLEKTVAAENKLNDVHLTGNEEDSFRNPMGLYEQLLGLLNNLELDGADLEPTDQQVEVNEVFKGRIASAEHSLGAVIQTDLPELNQYLRTNNLGAIAP